MVCSGSKGTSGINVLKNIAIWLIYVDKGFFVVGGGGFLFFKKEGKHTKKIKHFKHSSKKDESNIMGSLIKTG